MSLILCEVKNPQGSCHICWEDFKKNKRTFAHNRPNPQCEYHLFHEKCLKKYANRIHQISKLPCPDCRQIVDISPLYSSLQPSCTEQVKRVARVFLKEAAMGTILSSSYSVLGTLSFFAMASVDGQLITDSVNGQLVIKLAIFALALITTSCLVAPGIEKLIQRNILDERIASITFIIHCLIMGGFTFISHVIAPISLEQRIMVQPTPENNERLEKILICFVTMIGFATGVVSASGRCLQWF